MSVIKLKIQKVMLAFLALWATLFASSHLTWAQQHCRDEFQKFLNQALQISNSDLHPQLKQFLTEVYLSKTGPRSYLKAPSVFRACSASRNCVEITEFAGSLNKSLRFTVDRELREPVVETSARFRTLHLPENYSISDHLSKLEGKLQIQLQGHDLHPGIITETSLAESHALGIESFVLKEEQAKAIEAFVQAKKTSKSFLYVSPTGTGKSEVLKGVLEEQILNSKKHLHILVSDQTNLTRQLRKDVEAVAQKIKDQKRVRIIEWGGDSEKMSFEELLKLLEQNPNEETVLISTAASLRTKFKGQELDLVKSTLATFLYDEAHHAGAKEIKAVIEKLTKAADSEAILVGTTATPVHRETQIMDALFEHVYFSYNKADDVSESTSVEKIIDQLSSAMKQGDLTNLGHTYFIEPKELENAGEAFFINKSSFGSEIDAELAGATSLKYKINPKYYEKLSKKIRPLFVKHQKGFVSVSTKKEAEELAEYFSKKIPGKKFAFLHSGMDQKAVLETEAAFREGKINFLFTVRKMDEGVNYPDLTLYVDLNKSVGPRQFLQRLGRVLRLAPGKEEVEVLSLLDVSEESLRENLILLESLVGDRIPTGGVKKAAEEAGSSLHRVGLSKEELATEFYDEKMYVEELKHLHQRVKQFWTAAEASRRQVRTPESLAREINAHAEKFGEIKTSNNNPLYSKLFHARKNGALEEDKIDELIDTSLLTPEGKKALEAFKVVKWEKRTPESLAREINAQAEKFGEIKTSNNAALYKVLLEARRNGALEADKIDEFIDTNLLTPEGKKAIETFKVAKFEKRTPESLAREINAHAERFGEIKQSNDKALYSKLFHARKNGALEEDKIDELIDTSLLTPEGKKALEAFKVVKWEKRTPESFAREINVHAEKFEEINKSNNAALYKVLLEARRNGALEADKIDEFIDTNLLTPEGKKAIETFKVAKFEKRTPESLAREINAHAERFGEIKQSNDKALYSKLFHARKNGALEEDKIDELIDTNLLTPEGKKALEAFKVVKFEKRIPESFAREINVHAEKFEEINKSNNAALYKVLLEARRNGALEADKIDEFIDTNLLTTDGKKALEAFKEVKKPVLKPQVEREVVKSEVVKAAEVKIAEAPAPQVSKAHDPSTFNAKVKKSMARNEKLNNKKENAQIAQELRNQELAEQRKTTLEKANQILKKQESLTNSEIHTLEKAEKIYLNEKNQSQKNLVSAKIQKALKEKATQATVSAPDRKRIQDHIHLFGKAEKDFKTLPKDFQSQIEKRIFLKIIDDPVGSGMLDDWGSAGKKTRSMKISFRGQEHRILYLVHNNTIEIIFIGTKEDMLRETASRVKFFLQTNR